MLIPWKQFLKIFSKLPIYLSLILTVSIPQPALAQCLPPNFPSDWLQQQELVGGHTIERHVGKTDWQLVNRLKNDRRIAAASTYYNEATAATNIEAALRERATRLNNWFQEADRGAKLAIDYNAQQNIGRVATRPPSLDNIHDSQKLRAVIKKQTPQECFLLTSFPI